MHVNARVCSNFERRGKISRSGHEERQYCYMMGYSRYPRVGWGVQFNDGLWVIEHRLGEKHCGIWQLLKGNAIIWEYLEVNVSQAGGL